MKYDWSNVPEQVNWLATDKTGCAFGYDIKPKMLESGYFIHESDFLHYPKRGWVVGHNGRWEDSLEQRAEVANETK